ncbi:MAG: SCO family protein [Fimbriimonadales bacterium]|nr:SCO family protein [Fimbriimonadales bacterium]MDW8051050.1 SCO family protein [Armatimonadota bacterium]
MSMRVATLFAWGLLVLALGALVFALMSRQAALNQAESLPILGVVDTSFRLTNQWGETVTREQFKGKVWVAYFFFTRCPSVCPIINRNAITIQRAYADNPDVFLVGFSVDPKHDTVAVLQKWSQRHGAIKGKWHFLTGEREVIYNLSRKTFKLGVDPGDAQHPIVHSDRFVLVDRQGRIRGYYSGMDPAAVQQLIADIQRVLKE